MAADKLNLLEDLLRDLEPAFVYIGRVDEIRENQVCIDFSDGGKGSKKQRKIFPVERLAAIEAAFEEATVKYTGYKIGNYSINVLEYVGPSKEELLAQEPVILPKEVIDRLEEDYP